MNIVVVGGGVFGCMVTYMLSRHGCKVTLIDKDLPGKATSASAGGLWAVGESIGLGCGVIFHAKDDTVTTDVGPEPLPREFMDFLLESNRYFPTLTREFEQHTGIYVETESDTGLLYVIYNDAEYEYANSLLSWLGDSDVAVEELSRKQVCAREPLLTTQQQGGIFFPGDNQINPMLLADAARRSAVALGATYQNDTQVTGLRMQGGNVAGVETNKGDFDCDVLVNAAGTWSGQLAAMAGLQLPIFPVRGQILCTEAMSSQTLKMNLSTSDCYILQKAHGEILIGSTTEFSGYDVEVPVENLIGLANGASRALPALRQATVKRSWSGLRPGTPDEFPVLGPVDEVPNYFNATGGFRTGIVGAPLSADMVAAHILGLEQPFEPSHFLASRFSQDDIRLSAQIGSQQAPLSD
ncbi:MAG: NAD(P)/FAD-dependent oxidoreductase [Gammaproteobacteria bacterium]